MQFWRTLPSSRVFDSDMTRSMWVVETSISCTCSTLLVLSSLDSMTGPQPIRWSINAGCRRVFWSGTLAHQLGGPRSRSARFISNWSKRIYGSGFARWKSGSQFLVMKFRARNLVFRQPAGMFKKTTDLWSRCWRVPSYGTGYGPARWRRVWLFSLERKLRNSSGHTPARREKRRCGHWAI